MKVESIKSKVINLMNLYLLKLRHFYTEILKSIHNSLIPVIKFNSLKQMKYINMFY
jgi:hypothetical protein